jgi:hypothetical protein
VTKLTIQQLLPECYGQRVDEPRGSNKGRLVRGGKIAIVYRPGTPAPISKCRGTHTGMGAVLLLSVIIAFSNSASTRRAMRKERAQAGDVPIELLVQHPVIVFKKDEMEVPARGNPLTARARMLPPQEYDHAFDGKLPDVHAKGEVRLGFHGQVRLLQVCALAACPHRHLFKLRPHGFRALARLCR